MELQAPGLQLVGGFWFSVPILGSFQRSKITPVVAETPELNLMSPTLSVSILDQKFLFCFV